MIQVILILIILKEALLVLHVEKKKGLYLAGTNLPIPSIAVLWFPLRLHPRVPSAAIRRVRVL